MNTYLAKLNEILSFINKMKQIYDLNTFSQKPKNISKKLKKDSMTLLTYNIFTEPITELLLILQNFHSPPFLLSRKQT